MRWSSLVLAASALGVAAVPAQAAAPWSAPLSVAVPSPALNDAHLAFAPDGRALVSWNEAQDGRLAVASAAGVTPQQPLPSGYHVAGLAGDRVVVQKLRYVKTRSPAGGRRLDLRSATLGGPFAPAVHAAVIPHNSVTSLAVDPADAAAIAAWTEVGPTDGCQQTVIERLRVVVRAGEGRFSRPSTLRSIEVPTDDHFCDAQTPLLSLAAGHRGDVLLAYSRSGRVEVRLKRRDGRWRAPQDLGPIAGYPASLQAAVTPTGRAYVAWSSASADGQAVIRAAVLPAGRTAFRPATEVSRTASTGRLLLSTGAGGRAALAFTAFGPEGPTPPYGASAAIQVSTSTADGTLGPPAAASPASAIPASLALSPRGDVLAVWTTPSSTTQPSTRLGNPGRVQAALRPAGAAAFTPVEDVTPDEIGPYRTGASAAFDPVTGTPAIAWIGQDEVEDRVQIALRAG